MNTPKLNSNHISNLVYLLHNDLRVMINQLTYINKMHDYVFQSLSKDVINYIGESLREISDDILKGKVKLEDNLNIFLKPKVVGLIFLSLY